jgi:hypothetical protein
MPDPPLPTGAPPAAPVRPTPDAQQISEVEAASRQLLLEMSKTLLSGTLATTRGAMQILQGLTGILLASYTTLLVGFGKQVGFNQIPIRLAALPVLLYLLSLFIGFGQILLYRGVWLTIGDLRSGLDAYEALVAAQRRQLILPLIFSFAGLVATVVVAVRLLRPM